MSSTLPELPVAKTVDDVLANETTILNWSLGAKSRIGYFAALYYQITLAIEAAINASPPVFANPALITQLDVTFANRYFTALNAYNYPNGGYGPVSACWEVALNAAGEADPIILQQLGVAMSAHIGLDLGVASATVKVDETDFDEVNQVLDATVQTVVTEIDSLSPVLAEVFAVLGKYEIDLINVGLNFTRALSWDFVTELTQAPQSNWPALISAQDAKVAVIGETIMTPPTWIQDIINVIAALENRDVTTIINTLNPPS